MSDVEAKAKPEAKVDSPAAVWSPEPTLRSAPRRRLRILPLLITLTVIAVAVVLGRAMWGAYMGAPWTRDGTVRAYVVTMAPEVAGRIVELPVADNQFVHKGTNLLTQLGDYASVGTNVISLVDADSFWIDGYFEETNLEPI
jgi:multidrug resistance efflux pump